MKIMLKDICFSYPSHDVLDEVTMEVSEGEIVNPPKDVAWQGIYYPGADSCFAGAEEFLS